MVFSQRAGCLREFDALLKCLRPSPPAPAPTPAMEEFVCAECSKVSPRERTSLGLQGDQDRVPGPVPAEASMTLPVCLPRPELHWQITPCTPCPKTVDRPLNQRAMRPHRPAHRPFQRRQRRLLRTHPRQRRKYPADAIENVEVAAGTSVLQPALAVRGMLEGIMSSGT